MSENKWMVDRQTDRLQKSNLQLQWKAHQNFNVIFFTKIYKTIQTSIVEEKNTLAGQNNPEKLKKNPHLRY